MATIKLKRGLANLVDNYVGEDGEVVIDQTNWRLHICDGITTGGHIVSVATADTATKAISDGNGNNIANTYATKTALSSIEQRLAAIESNFVTKNNPVMTGIVTIEG